MSQTQAGSLNIKLPASLVAERQGDVAILRLARPHRRNALDDETVIGIETFFTSLPDASAPVLLHGEGEHFSAGLAWANCRNATSSRASPIPACGIAPSRKSNSAWRRWSRCCIGAVIGGGLELAAAAHVRVAEHSTYYALPEGSRGIYVGAAARCGLPRLIGVAA